VTAVPLLYISVLATDSFTKADGDFSSRGTTYVLSYSIFASLFKWSFAFKMLAPKKFYSILPAEPIIKYASEPLV
jgi:hypothetical protein